MSQYDWLKGSHKTKVVWLPNETDYTYCKFVAPNTSYSLVERPPLETLQRYGRKGGLTRQVLFCTFYSWKHEAD